jgi:hypothetical protein
MASLNADGLMVKYGNEQSAPSRGGEVSALVDRVTEVIVVGTEVPLTATTASSTNIATNHGIEIPAGAQIAKVEFIVETAFTSGGSAVLNVGLVRADRSTELDFDGIIAALPLANMNVAGETNSLRYGSSNAGALVGGILSNKGIVTLDYDTAAFTAGKGVVRITWRMPSVV